MFKMFMNANKDFVYLVVVNLYAYINVLVITIVSL